MVYKSEIPREIIAEIIQRLDLVQWVSQFVSLKRVGSYWMGKCPFHPDNKSPSFAIRTGGHTFRCFGCLASGDAITFQRLWTGAGFMEVVREFADHLGIRIPEKPLSQEERERREQKKSDESIMEIAQTFFVHSLETHGEKAKAFVKARGYTDDFIRTHDLGFGGSGWEGLVTHLQGQKVDLSRAAELGLIIPKKGQGYFDRFRGRLTFPIRDEHENLTGFGGRVLEKNTDQAKYLNSPESPLYKKSLSLFRMGEARKSIQKAGFVILSEGYFDALSFVASGFDNAVACCGSALTAQQVRLLKRYTSKVITAFDGDRAGLKATVAAMALLLSAGMSQEVLVLPDGSDPDSVWQKEKGRGLAEKVKGCVPVMDFVLERLRKHGEKSISAKTKAISRMARYVEMIPSPVERELYVQKTASVFGIRPDLVVPHTVPPKPKNAPATKPANTSLRPEEMMVGLLLNFPEVISQVPLRDMVGNFPDENFRALLSQILDDYERYHTVLMDVLLEAYPQWPIASWKSKACEVVDLEVVDKILKDCMTVLKHRAFRDRKENLVTKLKEAEQSGNEEGTRRILEELQTVLHEQQKWLS